MRRTVLLSAFAVAAMLGVAGVAAAQVEPVGQLDASCAPEGGGHAFSSYQARVFAQTFTANTSGTLTSVSMRGVSYSSRVEITTVDDAGLPTNNILASASVGRAEPEVTANFDIDSAASVLAGEDYAPVYRGVDGNSIGWWFSGDNDPCDGGFYQLSNYTGSQYWEPLGLYTPHRHDGYFSTYVSPDVAAPTGSLAINGGKLRTQSRTVTMALVATDPSPGTGVDSMRLKNARGNWTAWQPYSASKSWKLTRGAVKKTVYAQYRDAAGNVSAKASDSITYRP